MAITGKTAAIEDGLHFRLSQLTLSPTRRVAWPNATFTPVQKEIYLAPTVFWNTSERGEIGPGAARRHIGIYQIMARGPLVADLTQEQVADAVIEWFDRQVFTRNGITVRVGSFNGGAGVPWRGPAMPDTGWRAIPITVPFWADTFPT